MANYSTDMWTLQYSALHPQNGYRVLEVAGFKAERIGQVQRSKKKFGPFWPCLQHQDV